MVHKLQLGAVSRSDLNENVLGVKRNLRLIAVDDGRERANGAVSVEDDGVYRRVANNVEIAAEILVFLQNLISSETNSR